VLVKTTRMKRALIAKLAPQRLISLVETAVVRTLTLDVENYILVCSWAATPPRPSKHLSCKF
jgi:hypothetical protein